MLRYNSGFEHVSAFDIDLPCKTQSVSIGLKAINLENNAVQAEFSVTPDITEIDSSLGLITGVELLSVTNTFTDTTITPHNITCRMFEDEFGITPRGAAFSGCAGAATSGGSATTSHVQAGYVLCLVNDGVGDCPCKNSSPG